MEYLGLLGLVAFIYVMKLNKVPEEISGLKRKIKKLEKTVFGIGNKEAKDMSRLIEELKGKWCKVDSDELVMQEKVQICDVDEDWVKVMYKENGRKNGGKEKIKIIRVDSIDSIELLENEGE